MIELQLFLSYLGPPKMSQVDNFWLKYSWCSILPKLEVYNKVNHNCKGYISFIVIIKYLLYSLDSTIYPCTLFYIYFLIEVKLLYNVSFCCTIWFSYRYTYITSFLSLYPILLGHHRTPSWAHYATQHFPTSYVFYTWFSSVAQSCPTLWDPMDLPVHHQLLEFTQTHVHWVSDSI